jgi:hypothetical protein
MDHEDELRWVDEAWPQISDPASISTLHTVGRQTFYVVLMQQLVGPSDSSQASATAFRVTAKSFEI